MADHPLASQLPRPSELVAFFGDPDNLTPLTSYADAHTSIDDYLYSDEPQLGLHITSFADTTLVCLHWPHWLFDVMSKKALMQAWALMLEGRPNEIPATYGDDVDPLSERGNHPVEPHKLSANLLSLFDIGVPAIQHTKSLRSGPSASNHLHAAVVSQLA